MMNLIVLQHIPIEDPGYLKDLMLRDGCRLMTIELDKGERIPEDLAQFDAMVCMGGPMDTWMEEAHPWLIEEKQKIKHYVNELEKPFVGFCLGAQLLGEAIGGEVVPSDQPEVGVLDVHVSSDAAGDALFGNFPEVIKSVQWHSYEVRGLDDHPDVAVLGSSPMTRYQIFRYKQHAYGIQFHIEVRPDTLQQWSKVPAYQQALENTLGAGALAEFDAQAQRYMPAMNALCEELYQRFKSFV